MMSRRSVSIIIPHKNALEDLGLCLDSIPVQEGVQILVVDDDSDPESVDFDQFPGSERPDVEIVLTKEGRGAGYARNVGLSRAKGEWILFADADDVFDPEGLRWILEADIPGGYEVVLLPYRFYRHDGSYYVYPSPQEEMEAQSGEWRVCDQPNILCRKAVMPWAKMVRRGLLERNHIVFEEVKWGNDVLFATALSLEVSTFLIAPRLVYIHRWNPNSLVNGDPGDAMLFNRAKCSLRRAKMLQQAGRLDYNIFSDGWYTKLYASRSRYAVSIVFRTFLTLGMNDSFRKLMAYLRSRKHPLPSQT